MSLHPASMSLHPASTSLHPVSMNPHPTAMNPHPLPIGNRCNEANHVPALRTVQPDLSSVIGDEAPGRLQLTVLLPSDPLRTPSGPRRVYIVDGEACQHK
eukprot:7026316-Pyramimonas_sp.AAC.1